ncbi:hypothetical protein [Levilactobacillus brevis]|uniref:hypothetical protein n=1 Tax=Levilactobacillus brevis TaxID=1580 RepID=UPI00111B9CEC|nr:hypothetical protein [Levilactobacillus brevis]QCZ44835.1 hypothetical protein UCCLBBS124_pA0039 [Levilactobacillus brevis]
MEKMTEFAKLWWKYFWLKRSAWNVFKKVIVVPIFLILTMLFWGSVYNWLNWNVLYMPYNPLIAFIILLYFAVGLILYPYCLYYWWFLWLDKRFVDNKFDLQNGDLYAPQQMHFGLFAWLFRLVWHFFESQFLLVLWPFWFSLAIGKKGNKELKETR